MRKAGRITAMAMLALALPGVAAAQDAFIRIEAKRGAAAETAVEGWRGRFPDVVTFPLPNGMTAIVLGPQTPAEAAARMARLKAEGVIPADSYLAGPGGDAPLPGLAAALEGAEAAEAEAEAAETETPDGTTEDDTTEDDAAEDDAAEEGTTGSDGAAASQAGDDAAAGATGMPTQADAPEGTQAPRDDMAGGGRPSVRDAAARRSAPALAAPASGADAEPAQTRPEAVDATPPPEAPSDADASEAAADPVAATPDTSPRHIQLQATPGRASADAALAEWRQSFPRAELWQLRGGWYAIALPARPAGEAAQLMGQLKSSGRIPGDAFLATPGELGQRIAAGAAPDTSIPATGVVAEEPAPPAPAVMPPIGEVQRALRWAGLYDGALDGQSGPGTRAAIDAQVQATGGTATPAAAMIALIEEREAWRRDMGLEPLKDEATGLTLLGPMTRLAFDRTERGLSIYGPKDGSGAALILFAQPGGQQEMEDLAGLVTALGWVPHPERDVSRGRFTLTGANDLHVGHAEGRVQDGMAEGWVLIWPAADADNARRLAIEAGESFARTTPAENAQAAP